jgi:hypothetical protein
MSFRAQRGICRAAVRVAIIALLGVLAPATSAAQNPMQRLPEVRRLIASGQGQSALQLLDSLAATIPDHPNIPYLRAHAFGSLGRADEAVAELTKLMRLDPRYAQLALRDSSVIALRPRFPQLDSLVAAVSAPVSTATVWATLGERDLVPEGTAYDPATRSVLLGSLNKHKIIAIAPDGSVSDRVAPGSEGLRSVTGIHVDSARGVLWATSNARYDTPADSTPSALFAFDARTGRFLRRLALPVTGAHFLNDLTTDPAGTVYVTDMRADAIWFASPRDTVLRPFTAAGTVLAPNGITISGDGRTLFIATMDHVRVHDIRSAATWRLQAADGIGLTGIDGLAFVDGALIAHHPLQFARVARYELDPSMRRVLSRTLIDANTADGRTSTTGERFGADYVFIGNSQIDRMNMRTLDAATMDPVRIYRIRVR